MSGPWVINGWEVNPIYLLLEDVERVGAYLDSMPEGHPDEAEWIARYDALWAKIAEVRKCTRN